MTTPFKRLWSNTEKSYVPKLEPARMQSKHSIAESAMSHSPSHVGALTWHLCGSSLNLIPLQSLSLLCVVHEGIRRANHLSGNKCLLSCLGSSWCQRSLNKKKRKKKAATAAMRAPTSLDAVNIYPPAIIAAPWGLGATACWVNRGAEMGNKWAVCIWQWLSGATD